MKFGNTLELADPISSDFEFSNINKKFVIQSHFCSSHQKKLNKIASEKLSIKSSRCHKEEEKFHFLGNKRNSN